MNCNTNCTAIYFLLNKQQKHENFHIYGEFDSECDPRVRTSGCRVILSTCPSKVGWCELWWMFLSSHWTVITTAGSPIYIFTLLYGTWGSGTFSWSLFFFFLPDSKCHPRVDIPPNTHCSACNMHHFQCSLVWPLGVEAEHKYTELKMAAWWMHHVWHSRVNKQ